MSGAISNRNPHISLDVERHPDVDDDDDIQIPHVNPNTPPPPPPPPDEAIARRVEILHAHDYINACLEGDQDKMEELLKSYKDEHHFTRFEIEEDLRKAFNDVANLKPDARDPRAHKAINEQFNKLYDATHGQYSKKKLPLKIWLVAGALFIGGVIAIAAGAGSGVGFIPGLMLGGAAIGFCFLVLGLYKKDNLKANAGKEPINTQFEDNIQKLKKAHTITKEIEAKLEALEDQQPDHPDLPYWKTTLDEHKQKVKSLAKANNLEEAKKVHKRNNEKIKELSEARVQTTKDIKTFLADLEALNPQIPDLRGAAAQSASAAGTPPQTPAEALATQFEERAQRTLELADSKGDMWVENGRVISLKDTLETTLNGKHLTETQTQYKINDDFKNTIRKLTPEQYDELIESYGSEQGFLDAIDTKFKEDSELGPLELDIEKSGEFADWLDDVVEAFPPITPQAPSGTSAAASSSSAGSTAADMTLSPGSNPIVSEVDKHLQKYETPPGLHNSPEIEKARKNLEKFKVSALRLTPEQLQPVLTQFGGADVFVNTVVETVEKKGLAASLLTFSDAAGLQKLTAVLEKPKPKTTSAASSSEPVVIERPAAVRAVSDDERRANAATLPFTPRESHAASSSSEPAPPKTKKSKVAVKTPVVPVPQKNADLSLAHIEDSSIEPLKMQQEALKLIDSARGYSWGFLQTLDIAYKRLLVMEKSYKSPHTDSLHLSTKASFASMMSLIKEKIKVKYKTIFDDPDELSNLYMIKRALIDAHTINADSLFKNLLLERIQITSGKIIDSIQTIEDVNQLEEVLATYRELLPIYPELQFLKAMISDKIKDLSAYVYDRIVPIEVPIVEEDLKKDKAALKIQIEAIDNDHFKSSLKQLLKTIENVENQAFETKIDFLHTENASDMKSAKSSSSQRNKALIPDLKKTKTAIKAAITLRKKYIEEEQKLVEQKAYENSVKREVKELETHVEILAKIAHALVE